MEVIRRSEQRFDNLKDYPFDARYVEMPVGDGSNLRMHYLDEGQARTIIEGVGRFVHDDAGEELAQVVIDFIRANRR